MLSYILSLGGIYVFAFLNRKRQKSNNLKKDDCILDSLSNAGLVRDNNEDNLYIDGFILPQNNDGLKNYSEEHYNIFKNISADGWKSYICNRL